MNYMNKNMLHKTFVTVEQLAVHVILFRLLVATYVSISLKEFFGIVDFGNF